MSNSDELDEILSEIRNRQSQEEGTETKEVISEANQESAVFQEEIKLNFDEPQQEAPAPSAEPEPEPAEAEEEAVPADAADIYQDVFSAAEVAESTNEYAPFEEERIGAEEYPEEEMETGSNKKKIIIAVVAVVAVIAIAVGVYFGFFHNKDTKEPAMTTEPTTETTTAAPVVMTNPFTGEEDYNSSAIGKRPVACVVENAEAARPQWGIDSPDIIVEGEVEGGESRMLWLYADYTSVPEKIGPVRSARPPFIRFSEMFDAIFVHWGQSKSKGNYVGANTVFKQDNVDHINQMSYSGSVKLFSRDSSRKVSSEHTGVLNGKNLNKAFQELKFRTDVKESNFTTFNFDSSDTAIGNGECNTLALTFSNRSRTRDWTYNKEDKMYHTSDYKTDVKVKNLIVLFDNTTYVTKANYKGTGKGETYCDYALKGGKGVVAAEGKYTEITWSKKDGKLSILDANGKDIALKVGRSWIGYASSNNGGKVAEG